MATMRSSLRLLNLEVTPLQGSRTLYVCSVCRQEARPRPLGTRQFLRNASDSTPITERVRRKLWGTDNPPGLKDPYGGEGVFEKKFKKAQTGQQEETAAVEETQAAETESAVTEDAESAESSYQPATTWNDLQRVGHLGRWKDLPPTEADAYNSFFSNRRLKKERHLALAAHQAAVELCLLHGLNKPLARICDVVEHEEAVLDLIMKCKIQPKSEGQWDSAVVYPDKETEDALLYIFEQIGAEAPAPAAENGADDAAEEAESVEAAEEEPVEQRRRIPFPGHKEVQDKGFLSLSLADPVVKFAFLKRFAQLTGHYFPDPVIQSFSSLQQVMDHIQQALAPKPKKLAEQLIVDESLHSIPNVKVFPGKVRPWDVDEELGRKKLIDAELRERGLI
ncbi:ribosomal subunit 39S-domain-containing protein [Aspergillus egyptiacus]|nr:ribosomal subunit 39S-domain-containing protein [Aspergillus egyptiacus]